MTQDGQIVIYGVRGSAESFAIRDFLHRCDIPFQWIQLSNDEEARREALVDGLKDPRLPVCVFPDGTRIERPTIRQITEKLGWFHNPSREEYDLSIYGGGPAGLSAAVYGASEGLKTVLVERFAIGGQAGTSPKIENYLGFPDGISGAKLAEKAREQACRFGAEILLLREGVRGEFQTGKGVVYLKDGTKIVSRASICATGIEYRTLGIPEEERFRGAGVYYGAGASEASMCINEHVYVVGGGNSAAQAAVHFSKYAARVSLIVRDDSLKKSVSQYLVDRIHNTPNVEVIYRTIVVGLRGDNRLQEVVLQNRDTKGQWTVKTSWLFLCLGGDPKTEWAREVGIVRDEAGYLVTGPDLFANGKLPEDWPLDRQPYYLETNVPGVFAAGDVRHNSVKRCASAVGEGAMAVTFVHRYIMGN